MFSGCSEEGHACVTEQDDRERVRWSQMIIVETSKGSSRKEHDDDEEEEAL